jgi:F-type H+-transporting ATPase subunit epsilon
MSKRQMLNVKVLSENGPFFEGECTAIFVPVKNEKIAILPFHTPLISLMTEGEISVYVDGKSRSVAKLKEGIIYVGENEVVALVNG